MRGRAASLLLSIFLAGGARADSMPAAMRVYQGELAGLAGLDGRLLAAPAFSRCGEWREERLWVEYPEERTGEVATGHFLDAQARPLAPARYRNLAGRRPELPLPFFDQGVAVVGLPAGELGYLDRQGRLLGRAAPAAAFQRQTGDLLLVEEQGRFGYIDRLGRVRIAARFNGATPFHGPCAAARLTGQWGLIDAQGAWAALPAFDELLPLDGAPRCWAFRSGDFWGLVDVAGSRVAVPAYDVVGVWHGGAVSVGRKACWGLLSANGRLLVEPRYATLAPVEKAPGLWRAQALSEGWGVVDSNGTEVVACRFDAIFPMAPGLWRACDGGCWGVWSQAEGRWAVEPRHARVLPIPPPFAGGVLAEQGGRWGTIDLATGRAVLPCRYSRIEPWLGWLAAAEGRDIRLFDPAGQMRLSWAGILEGLPDPTEMEHGLGVLRKSAGATLITRDAVLVWTNDVEAAGAWSEGRVAVRSQGRWGFVDRRGAWVVPPRFEAAGRWTGGVAPVREKGRWGLLGGDGEFRVKPVFDEAGSFWNGCLPVRRAGRWGLIDARGATVLPCAYDGLEWGFDAGGDPLRHGACPRL